MKTVILDEDRIDIVGLSEVTLHHLVMVYKENGKALEGFVAHDYTNDEINIRFGIVMNTLGVMHNRISYDLAEHTESGALQKYIRYIIEVGLTVRII